MPNQREKRHADGPAMSLIWAAGGFPTLGVLAFFYWPPGAGMTMATFGHLSAVASGMRVLAAQLALGMMLLTIAPNVQGVMSDHRTVQGAYPSRRVTSATRDAAFWVLAQECLTSGPRASRFTRLVVDLSLFLTLGVISLWLGQVGRNSSSLGQF